MDKAVIYVNSLPQFRDAGTSNEDFTITKNIQEFRTEPISAKLISASIPYTWNNVTPSNSTFTITENTVGTDNFIIPNGNYDGTQLADVLQNVINSSGILTLPYTVVFDTQTLVFTITAPGPNGIQISFTEPGSAASLLGFTPGSVFPGVFAASITSENKAVLLQDYEIFICSDIVRGSDNGVIPWNVLPAPDADNQNQILARVPILGCFSSVLSYKASLDIPYYLITGSKFSKSKSQSDSSTTTIRFFLKFPSGETVDLNGYHWTAELVLNFTSSM